MIIPNRCLILAGNGWRKVPASSTHVCREEETDHVPSLGDDGCGSCAGGCIVC